MIRTIIGIVLAWACLVPTQLTQAQYKVKRDSDGVGETQIGRWAVVLRGYPEYAGTYSTGSVSLDVHESSLEITMWDPHPTPGEYHKHEISIYFYEGKPKKSITCRFYDRNFRAIDRPACTEDIFAKYYRNSVTGLPREVRESFFGFYGFPVNRHRSSAIYREHLWDIDFRREQLAGVYARAAIRLPGLANLLRFEQRWPRLAMVVKGRQPLGLKTLIQMNEDEVFLRSLVEDTCTVTIRELGAEPDDIKALHKNVAWAGAIAAIECVRQGAQCFNGSNWDDPIAWYGQILFGTVAAGLLPQDLGSSVAELCELGIRQALRAIPPDRLLVWWVPVNKRFRQKQGDGILRVGYRRDLSPGEIRRDQLRNVYEIPVRVSGQEAEQITVKVLGQGFNWQEDN